ncbi:hypothetical protein C805_01532 [Eubacterium sp. 14-2]|nr:hypothetical protein C805_01532 [Eubacterium sp. 14-2]
MAIITPNFNFMKTYLWSDGKCEEAIYLYQKAFEAEINCLLRYSDAKWEDFHRELSEEQKEYIYHAELLIGNQRIMVEDNPRPFQVSCKSKMSQKCPRYFMVRQKNRLNCYKARTFQKFL